MFTLTVHFVKLRFGKVYNVLEEGIDALFVY